MKTLIKRLTVHLLYLITATVFVSCQNDDSFEPQSEQELIEFKESKIISFDVIEEMTQNKIEGELAIEEDKTLTRSDKTFGFNISREKRVYDFSATVNNGVGSGTEITGELKLNFTLYHASFTIVRGKLTLPDGTVARTRGAIICDGVVYLVINPPGRDLIFGIGKVGQNGNLEGGFRLFTSGGIGRGTWGAVLTETTFPDKTIVELIIEDGRFTSLVGALQATDLVDALSEDGPFTVFAPTDEAFAILDQVPSGDALKNILLYHVASGRLTTSSLLAQEMITTLQGEDVKVMINGDNEIVLNDTVKLISANIGGSNGVIQVVDAVLIPPSFQPLPSIVEIAVNTPDLSTLVGALQAVDLVDTLSGDGPFTVFAPTNKAFETLDAIPNGDALKEVLLYHVASGKFKAVDLLEKQTVKTLQGDEVTIEADKDGNVFLNGNIKVMMADIKASNGIVHLIEGVLLPPEKLQSIVEIAVNTPDLSTLVGALQAADLVGALSDDGPFTVFAPTNTAFEALDAIPSGDVLKEVLLYHVASGKFTAENLLEKQTVKTLQGDEVTIEADKDGNVFLNGNIKVMIANVKASNGIIHVIENVLIPSSLIH